MQMAKLLNSMNQVQIRKKEEKTHQSIFLIRSMECIKYNIDKSWPQKNKLMSEH